MMECKRCRHDSHDGRMCGQYNTRTIRDDVGFAGPPSGKTWTLIDSVCQCVSLAVMSRD